MAITREHDVDDDGSGLTGSVRDAAWKERLYDQIDAALIVGGSAGNVTLTTPGTYHNLTLPNVDVVTIQCNPGAVSGDFTLSGFANARAGQRVIIRNGGAAGLTVVLFTNGSGSAYPLYNFVTSGTTPIASGGTATYVGFSIGGVVYYCLAQHDQGKAIRVPYNAANYTGNVGSWTVPSANIRHQDYFLRGNLLTMDIYLDTTSPAGSPLLLYVAGWPYAFQTAHATPALVYNGSWNTALCQCEASLGRLFFGFVTGAAWPAVNTNVYATVTVPIG